MRTLTIIVCTILLLLTLTVGLAYAAGPGSSPGTVIPPIWLPPPTAPFATYPLERGVGNVELYHFGNESSHPDTCYILRSAPNNTLVSISCVR